MGGNMNLDNEDILKLLEDTGEDIHTHSPKQEDHLHPQYIKHTLQDAEDLIH